MDRTFSPCALSGVAAVPPSKSEAHRRMICAALTPGETRLTGFLPSRDMTATMDCLSALGASFRVEGETLLVRGCGGPAAFAPRMDCGESGSTLRFLIPLALALGAGGGFLMGGRLGERPLEPYDPILEACGVTSYRESTPQGVLLTLRGRLRPGNYTLPGDVSSQFVTGMLYALPLLPGDSTLTVTPPVESAGYIRMTLQCLADSGIRLEETGPYAWRIPGNQRYRATGGALPGDWSQGAVLLCAGALGHGVDVAGLDLASTQGDRAALDVLFQAEKIDGVIHFAASSQVGESMSDPLKYYDNNLHGTMVLLSAMVAHGVDKIVFSSTAAAYGEPEQVPILETDRTVPTNCYGETKLSMERMMAWVSQAHGLRYVALRYFNAAGAHPSGSIGEAHTPETHLIPIILQVPLSLIHISEPTRH